MMRKLLEGSGCVAREAIDAESAFADAMRSPPDVVVTDLRLAWGAAGWALGDALRQEVTTVHVGLVAVTGVVEPEWKVLRSFDAYLRKPLDLDLFVRVVGELGRSVRARAAADRGPAIPAR
jgi:CheY-like chemotaxis protein